METQRGNNLYFLLPRIHLFVSGVNPGGSRASFCHTRWVLPDRRNIFTSPQGRRGYLSLAHRQMMMMFIPLATKKKNGRWGEAQLEVSPLFLFRRYPSSSSWFWDNWHPSPPSPSFLTRNTFFSHFCSGEKICFRPGAKERGQPPKKLCVVLGVFLVFRGFFGPKIEWFRLCLEFLNSFKKKWRRLVKWRDSWVKLTERRSERLKPWLKLGLQEVKRKTNFAIEWGEEGQGVENSFNLSGSHSPHSSVHFVTIVFSHLG